MRWNCHQSHLIKMIIHINIEKNNEYTQFYFFFLPEVRTDCSTIKKQRSGDTAILIHQLDNLPCVVIRLNMVPLINTRIAIITVGYTYAGIYTPFLFTLPMGNFTRKSAHLRKVSFVIEIISVLIIEVMPRPKNIPANVTIKG